MTTKEIWFQHAGTPLFAVHGGEGRPIVLLHGGLATHQACWLFAAPLAERYHLITPDLRGSGRSVFAAPLSWDLLADDVAALVRSLDLAHVIVGGISFGAAVAVRATLRHPDLFEGLVLVHPAYGGTDLGLSPEQLAAMQRMFEAGERTLTEGIGALLPLFDDLPDEIRERARRIVQTYEPGSVAITTRFMQSGSQPFSSTSELARLGVPTLVIAGVDPTHPRSVAERFAAHVPRSMLVESQDLAAAIELFVKTQC